NVDVRTGDAASLLPEFGNGFANGFAKGFDGVVLADVLYLLPPPSWPKLLHTVWQLMKPDGRLLLKESEGDGSLRHRKALFQEWVMVRCLGRTHSSGGMTLVNQKEMRRVLEEAGFVVEDVRDLRRGYTTPHILYVARASSAKAA
ncbi:MAG: methyltransferase domain-containing protein, partial [Myxococcaceae bacterium]